MNEERFLLLIAFISLTSLFCLFLAILLIRRIIRKEREKTEKMIMRILIVLLLLSLPAVAEGLPPFQPGGGPGPIALPELSRAGEALQAYVFGSLEDEDTWRTGALCFLNNNNSSENLTA